MSVFGSDGSLRRNIRWGKGEGLVLKSPSPCHSALRFVHHTPAADGLQDLDVPDAGRIDGFNITVEQYKIGKTARLDAPAVVFPAAAKGSIGRVGFQRLTRGNALIAPEQDTAVTDAVYRRVHTAEGGHRKDGRIHMQREGHTQTDAGTGGVHARGALGAKENGGVPISPDFDVPGEQARDDPASLHALKLRVGNELRMDEHVAQIRARADAYEALARVENPDFNKLYEADCRLHETWFSAMDKMYLWSTLQNAHADYSRFRMLDTMTTGGLDEVIADHRNLLNAIERCDLAAFEPLVERHLYGGIRRLGSKLTEEYADFFEPETVK